MTFEISKKAIMGAVLGIIGLLFMIQGGIDCFRIYHIKETYEREDIQTGRYIAFEVSKDMLLGHDYKELNGQIKYAPFCGTDAYTGAQRYMAAVNRERNYYVSLVVPAEYKNNFDDVVNGKADVIRITGKFKKLSEEFDYDFMSDYVGTSDKSEVEKVVSTSYFIQEVKLEEEKTRWIKGGVLLIVGLLLLFCKDRVLGFKSCKLTQ